MPSMALHGIVIQYKNADARKQTGGRRRTLTDIVGDDGKVWREAGGWDGMHGAALQYHGVVCRRVAVDCGRVLPRTR